MRVKPGYMTLRGQPTRARFQARMLHLAWTCRLVGQFWVGWSSSWGESRLEQRSSKQHRRIVTRSALEREGFLILLLILEPSRHNDFLQRLS